MIPVLSASTQQMRLTRLIICGMLGQCKEQRMGMKCSALPKPVNKYDGAF